MHILLNFLLTEHGLHSSCSNSLIIGLEAPLPGQGGLLEHKNKLTPELQMYEEGVICSSPFLFPSCVPVFMFLPPYLRDRVKTKEL